MDVYAAHSLIMRHILFIMLTTVCNIGSVVLQKKNTDGIPQHAFLNDYAVFRCSLDGKTNRSQNVELWRNDGTNGTKLIVSERSRNNKHPSFTTTASGFSVNNGSNSTHLRATVKAQCTHSGTYSCKNTHGSSFDMTRFEVVRRASKPNIRVLYQLPPYIAVCNGKEDPICTNCTDGFTTQVPREKDVKFLCNAELSTARDGSYFFDWRYDQMTPNQGEIMFYSYSDKKRMNGSWNSGTCAPRKAVRAEFSYRTGGTLGIVELHCKLKYKVGSLRQLTKSTLKICVSGIAESGRSLKAVQKKGALGIVIFGSVVGGIVVVSAVALLIFKGARRRQSKKDPVKESGGTDAADVKHNKSQQRREGKDTSPRASKKVSARSKAKSHLPRKVQPSPIK